MAKKSIGSPRIAKERQKHAVESIEKILLTKGVDSKAAQAAAKEVVAAGFCIVGGGVPL